MKIAIIGVGNVGAQLARAARGAGHDVVLSATSADKAAKVAADAGVQAAASNTEAAHGADVVVLAVPWGAARTVTAEIAAAVGTGIIVDATNPLKPDFSGLATGERSGAEELQDQAPNARFVKAFNTVFAGNLTNPVADGVQMDGFLAGNDAAAKKEVSELLSGIGFRPIDAGALSASRALEQLAFLNISLNAANGWSWQSAWKLAGPTG